MGQQDSPARIDTARGLDHGAWVLLMLMYPGAGIPVVHSPSRTISTRLVHVALGEAIAPLRKEGVLIIGSGGAVHPLGDPTVALGEGLRT